MDEWTEIRRKVLVEKASKRSIQRDYGIGHQALAKILAKPEPPVWAASTGFRRRAAPRSHNGHALAMWTRAFFSDRGRDAPGTESAVTRRGIAGKVVRRNCKSSWAGSGPTRRPSVKQRLNTRAQLHRVDRLSGSVSSHRVACPGRRGSGPRDRSRDAAAQSCSARRIR